MLRYVAITSLILAGICGIARADVYRWVDDHGEPHYSDRWVPGSELIKSNKPRPPTSDSSAAAHAPDQSKVATAADHALAQVAQQAAAQAVKQDVTKARDAQCKQAKERYEKAIQARRLFKPAKDTETDRVFMSDAEVDAYRLQARNDVKDACGSVPAPQP
jgi:delta 1-pyrroline-5-carboxylate dehydrogenase